jgi:hypothetical protein
MHGALPPPARCAPAGALCARSCGNQIAIAITAGMTHDTSDMRQPPIFASGMAMPEPSPPQVTITMVNSAVTIASCAGKSRRSSPGNNTLLKAMPQPMNAVPR